MNFLTYIRDILIKKAKSKQLIENKYRGIVFLATHPAELNQADGFAQRVLAIDSLFLDYTRLYIKITSKERSSIKKYDDGSLSVRLFFLDIFSLALVISTTLYYGVIYAHSAYACSRGTDTLIYCLPKVFKVFDAHGIIPEEYEYQNKKSSIRYKIAELIAIRQANLCVVVSSAMQEHFKNKYPKAKSASLLLPIFKKTSGTNLDSFKKDDKRKFRRPKFLYAGGTQPWQLLPLMLEGISSQLDKADYLILTPEKLDMDAALKKSFKASSSIKFGSATYDELIKIYKNYDYSFVLRQDDIVNKVACPTKLIECLECGLIPVLLFSDIGDFKKLGIRYLPFVDFLEGKLFSEEELEENQRINFKIISDLKGKSLNWQKELVKIISANYFSDQDQ